MGYMGFGMRKEVYTRKAKKAFNRIKEIYGDEVDTPHSQKKTRLKGPGKYVKHSYKPFYKSRPYVIFKRALFIAIVAIILLVVLSEIT